VAPEVAAGLIGAGALLGAALIAGWVSYRVGKETQHAVEQAWIRDSRRQLYDRFLDSAQSLLVACEECPHDEDAISDAHSHFFQAYGGVQLVAQPPVVEAARAHAYRLWELEEELLSKRPVLQPNNAVAVARSVRAARHDTIDAMRKDLDPEGNAKSAKPPKVYNPFDQAGGLEAADDDVRRLHDAYEKELEKAGEDKHNVRPGWKGSPHAAGAPTHERPKGPPR
jgi:hypothetical protein